MSFVVKVVVDCKPKTSNYKPPILSEKQRNLPSLMCYLDTAHNFATRNIAPNFEPRGWDSQLCYGSGWLECPTLQCRLPSRPRKPSFPAETAHFALVALCGTADGTHFCLHRKQIEQELAKAVRKLVPEFCKKKLPLVPPLS